MTDISWPAVTGSAPVGITRFELLDPLRAEPFAPKPRKGRRIQVHGWYPARPGTGGEPRAYFTPQEVQVLTAGLQLQTGSAEPFEPLTRLITNSRPDAAIEGAGLPLLVFNHGGSSHALQNTLLAEELASWGYVVLSLGHPYESGGVLLEDGEAAAMAPGLMAGMMKGGMDGDLMRYLQGGDYPTLLEAYRAKVRGARRAWLAPTLNLWAEDSLLAVDSLQSGEVPAAAASLAGAVDAGRVGYFGMSFGGAVTARLCQMDDRAVAGINLDGALWSWDTVGRDIPTPFLSIHSDPTLQVPLLAEAHGVELRAEFRTLSPATPLHDDLDLERHTELGLRPDVHRLVLPGLTHMGVTDFLVLEPLGVLPMPPDPEGRGVAMVNRLCLDFFDTWMKRRDTGFPAAARRQFPEIVERDLSRLREQARLAGGIPPFSDAANL